MISAVSYIGSLSPPLSLARIRFLRDKAPGKNWIRRWIAEYEWSLAVAVISMRREKGLILSSVFRFAFRSPLLWHIELKKKCEICCHGGRGGGRGAKGRVSVRTPLLLFRVWMNPPPQIDV